MKPLRIAFTRSLAEAGRIHSLLEAAGLHPLPVASASHVFSGGGAEQGYHVEIPEAETKAASLCLKQAGLSKCLLGA